MSWYNADYKYRTLVVAVGLGGTEDVVVTLPTNWDPFWDTVQSTGYDVRFTQADGQTEIAYERTTWTLATHSGVFKLNDALSSTSDRVALWMYWGYASATDVSAAFAADLFSTTGTIYPGSPSRDIIDLAPDAPGATVPAVEISILPSDVRQVWIKLDARDLVQRLQPSEGSTRFQEPRIFSATAYESDGSTASATLVASPQNKWVERQDGSVLASFSIYNGIDGSDYIVEFRCSIVEPGSTTTVETLKCRANFRCRAQSAT